VTKPSKRSPGRWRHVRYLKSGLTLERLTSIIQERFKWSEFEIGVVQGRKVASVDLENMDVLITELPNGDEEFNFQIHLTISREEGMMGQVLLERWQELLDELHEP
jgi:hypothetical protein